VTTTSIESRRAYAEHGLGLFSLLLCNYGDFFTGYLTTLFSEVFQHAKFLIVLLPVLMNLRGCTYVAYSTRMITKLRLGVIEPRGLRQKGLTVEMKVAYVVSILSNFIAGILAALVVDPLHLDIITAVAMISGLIGVSIVVPLSTLGFFIVYRRDISPETLAGPLESIIGDMITVPTLLLAYILVLYLYDVHRDIVGILIISILVLTSLITRSLVKERDKTYVVWNPEKTIIENVIAGVVASMIELVVGLRLESKLSTLTTYKVLLFAAFPTMAVVGGLAVRYAAYLNSGLHLGSVEHSVIPRGIAARYYYRSMLLSFGIYMNVICMSIIYAYFTGEPLILCSIPFIAGLLSTVIVLYITYILSIVLFRKGINPANVATSLIMPIADLTTITIYMSILSILH